MLWSAGGPTLSFGSDAVRHDVHHSIAEPLSEATRLELNALIFPALTQNRFYPTTPFTTFPAIPVRRMSRPWYL